MKIEVSHDRFDSELLGQACYKIRVTEPDEHTNLAGLNEAVAMLGDADSIVLFTEYDAALLREIHALGFALLGTRNWYGRAIALPSPPVPAARTGLRLMKKAEVGSTFSIRDLDQLIRSLVTRSRYWKDVTVPRETAVRVYERWFENSIRTDYADEVIVAQSGDEIAGIVTLRRGETAGYIDLIVVDDRSQGQGVGAALVAESLAFCASCELSTLRVETEGENIAANRFYQKLGFRTESHDLVFHSHPKSNG